MKAETTPNHLKHKHISHLNGPILFTAPHSKKLLRGGQLYNQKQRIHYRQTYTSHITLQLALITKLSKKQPNSFCFWGKSSQINQLDLDPNYLLPELMEKSPFHACLHAWAKKNQGLPLLHVDVHGKLNRQHNCQIQLGMESMRFFWKEDPLVELLSNYFQKTVSKIFEGIQFNKGYKCKINPDPQLHGLWGGHMQTMTQQATHLGIPSFQLEIPLQVRKLMFKDRQLLVKFGQAIKTFYIDILVPYYGKKTKPLKISKELALGFSGSIKSQKEIGELEEQVRRLEVKEELDLKGKKI